MKEHRLILAFLRIGILWLAISAAAISIYGLTLIYIGASVPTLIVASGMEAGKLLIVSILYRFWKDFNVFIKSILFVQLVILMAVTSAGVYGFLTSAYQQGTVPVQKIEKQISNLQTQQIYYEDQVKSIDAEVAETNKSYVTKRIELINILSDRRDSYSTKLSEISTKIIDKQSSLIEKEAHTAGFISLLTSQLDMTPEEGINIITLLLVLVLDPVAIMLTLCYNVIIVKRKEAPEEKELLLEEEEEVEEEAEIELPPTPRQSHTQVELRTKKGGTIKLPVTIGIDNSEYKMHVTPGEILTREIAEDYVNGFSRLPSLTSSQSELLARLRKDFDL